MAGIVLLEDEAILRQELAGFLERRGHRVSQAGSLAAFWPLMAAAEVAIIDIMLPDGEGFEAVQRLREASPQAGVILLTARAAPPPTSCKASMAVPIIIWSSPSS